MIKMFGKIFGEEISPHFPARRIRHGHGSVAVNLVPS